MRVYQLAKELNLSSKEVIDKLESLGASVGSHMAFVADDVIVKLKKSLNTKGSSVVATSQPLSKKKLELKTEPNVLDSEKKNVKNFQNPPAKMTLQSSTVNQKPQFEEEFEDLDIDQEPILEQFFEHNLDELEEDLSRHSNFGRGAPGQKTRRPGRFKRRRKNRTVFVAPVNAAVSKVLINKDLLLSELAQLTGKSVAELVLTFLKKGKAYTVNKTISQKEAIDFCLEAGIEVEMPDLSVTSLSKTLRTENTLDKADLRMPIVVVMGHVDHGKTSLLDYIRKSSVASGEAGGITQKISAYQVKTKHGEIVFIDTPGHEAFTLMRRCGAQITDIALIVIAADDGIMPQTQEAIELAKKTNAQIIIALNKVDKPNLEKNIENIKNMLATKHDVLIEEWGGNVILLQVSAKTGQGIDEMLEMIALQSEVMSLHGHRNHPARAFVLESSFQKGLGPVSSVIVTEGELSRGDSFVAGKTFGKVRAMENSYGKTIAKAGPSTLVKLTGFESLAEAGDILSVVDPKTIDKKSLLGSENDSQINRKTANDSSLKSDANLNLIIKVGTSGSLDAISKAFEKTLQKNLDLAKRLVIKKVSVGDVTCNDVILAEDMGADIMVFASGIDRNALEMAAEKKIKITTFSIIYKLVEATEELVKQMVDQETVYKESGRAQVIKVFDIKGKGVIAGCKVTDGRFVKNGKVVCMRNDKKIIETQIASLQHAKKSVAEVKKGFECGFVTDKFDGWQEGDVVICLEPLKRGQLNS